MLYAHSDVLLLVHIVFSTLNRMRRFGVSDDAWLREVLGAEACRHRAEVLAIGNSDDHVLEQRRRHATGTIDPDVEQTVATEAPTDTR
jgi:hypothetical protein